MPRKKKTPELTFIERVRRIRSAGIYNYKAVNQLSGNEDEIMEDLPSRVKKVLGIFNNASNNSRSMIYFIMYDIENNKIRTYIAKYLQHKGCTRVQKSIFLADTDRKVFDDIHKTLKEVQELYDNFDSIMLVPVSTDQIKAMKLIGQNIDFDLVLHNKNTLFF
ncbi:MAG: CRISPR-associated endonuclease Cas2 [Sphingobacteriia bacterium]|nr:CRISPR-associated endonuclease Cas2 [Sphingobacteriia bacterium]